MVSGEIALKITIIIMMPRFIEHKQRCQQETEALSKLKHNAELTDKSPIVEIQVDTQL